MKMLCLLCYERLGHLEEVVAENRYLEQMFLSTDGAQNRVQRLEGPIRMHAGRRPFNLSTD